MTRVTIDYGIDLGTTNSCVAVFEGADTKVIPNKDGNLITPSAVHIDKKGRLHVGAYAKKHAAEDEENTAIVFKRLMGKGEDARKLFKASGRSMLPEELSAEVLKSLRADVRDQRGEEVRAAVITYPADFGGDQCQATEKAAHLAGFTHCILLQEPIAAALAYGFEAAAEDSYWLVYDFGGGTFDAAVVHFEEGVPSVVTHAGNNHLGGSDIDRDIVVKKLVPALTAAHKLPPFDRSAAFWRVPYAKLLSEAEKAKIEVCRTRQPCLIAIDDLCADSAGAMIDFEHTLTPEEIREITAPWLAQSLALCRRALEAKGLAPERIEKVLMVGGSSLSPWVREEVAETLGRPLEIAINPMTVVAQGAAIYARSRKAPIIETEPPLGAYTVDIRSETIGEETTPPVKGIIRPPQGGSLEGVTIEFVREPDNWRSGKIEVREGGKFSGSLRAETGKAHTFRIELRAADGGPLEVLPNQISYVCKGDVEGIEVPLQQNIGVGMANGQLDVVLAKGKPLPAKGRTDHYTARPLKAGARGEAIRIPLYEGTNVARAARNRLLYEILIRGDQISRDLPAGSEVEITLHIDGNLRVTARAFVPYLDQEFEATVKYDDAIPSPERLREALGREAERYEELRDRVARAEDARVRAELGKVEEQDFERRISERLHGTPDPDSRTAAERWVRDYATALDGLEDALVWPTLVEEAQELLEITRKIVEAHGESQERQHLRELQTDLREAVASGSSTSLRYSMAELNRLRASVLQRQPAYWLAVFNYLKDLRRQMTDPRRAAALIDQGTRALANGEVDGLRSVVHQLWDLVPDEQPRVPPQLGAGDTQRAGL